MESLNNGRRLRLQLREGAVRRDQTLYFGWFPKTPSHAHMPVNEEGTVPYVRVKRQFEYIGGKVRIKINVANAVSQGLLRLKMALDLPVSFKLLRAEPSEYPRDGSTVKLGDPLPKEEKAVAWVLEPLICGKEKVGGTVSGVDANGREKMGGRCPILGGYLFFNGAIGIPLDAGGWGATGGLS